MRSSKKYQKSEYQLLYTIEGFYIRLSDMIIFDLCDKYQTFSHYNQEQQKVFVLIPLPVSNKNHFRVGMFIANNEQTLTYSYLSDLKPNISAFL